MTASGNKATYQHIDTILELIETLRGENGCPWDRKQTPGSIGTYVLEEVYELLEAIDGGDAKEICEELGDVLFLLLFLVDIFQDWGKFDLKEVIRRNSDKMVRRHPHVFGENKVKDAEEVKAQWHRIKKEEKPYKKGRSVLDGIPPALPALLRAYRILERVEKAGFGWRDTADALKMADETWMQFKAPFDTEIQASQLDFGDLLFVLVALGRCLKFNPETMVLSAVKKFEERFRQMEQRLEQDGKELEAISQDEKQRLWEQIKVKKDPY
jgi:nucleoside triphosphate diphosphatase